MAQHDPALDALFSATYEELRRLAASVRRDDPSATLNPTALVHEAYMKLAAGLRVQPESRLHFKRLTARAMRQVLVEAARRRNAVKRGGGVAFITFDEAADVPGTSADELITLDAALQELARTNPRQATMVECRFFGGMDMVETAELLQVSESTLLRDWRAARAWLSVALRGRGDDTRPGSRDAVPGDGDAVPDDRDAVPDDNYPLPG